MEKRMTYGTPVYFRDLSVSMQNQMLQAWNINGSHTLVRRAKAGRFDIIIGAFCALGEERLA